MLEDEGREKWAESGGLIFRGTDLRWRRNGMKYYKRCMAALLMAGAILGLGLGLVGAQGLGVESAAALPGLEELTVKGVEGRLAALEADTSLEEGVKEAGREKLTAALEQLKKRDADLAQMKKYEEVVATATEVMADLARQTAAAAVPEDAAGLVTAEERALPTDQLKAVATAQDATLGTQRNALSALTEKLATEKGRSGKIAGEMATAQQMLREAEAALAELQGAEVGSEEEAEQFLNRARKEAAEAALKKLDLEGRSSGQRLRVRQAKVDYEMAVEARAAARKKVLEGVLAKRLEEDVTAAQQMVKDAQEIGGKAGESLKQRAAEVSEISAELQRVASRVRKVGEEEGHLKTRLEVLRREKQAVDKQFELGVGRGAFAQMLIEQKAALPDPRSIRRTLAQRREEITEIRFAAFQVDEKISRQSKLEVAVKNVTPSAQEHARTLLDTRKDLLGQLEEQYSRLTRELGQVDLLERQMLDEVVEFDATLEEALFWVPSSPVVSVQTIERVPEDVAWLLGPTRWRELAQASGRMVRHDVIPLGILSGLLVVILLLRSRFRNVVVAHRIEIRKISTDRYGFTLKALGLILLMVLPLPLLLRFVGDQFVADGDAGPWVQGTGVWLMQSAWWMFALLFLRELCREDGLADVHFRWDKQQRALVRRDVTRIAMVYLPATWVMVLAFGEETSRMPHCLGRLTFVVLLLWVAGCLGHLMRPRDGLFSEAVSREPGGAVAKRRVLWFVLITGTPLLLVGLALFGYYFTALALFLRFAATVGILAFAYFFYWLVLRWFMIRERRAALDQVNKARKAKREALAAAAAEQKDGVEVVGSAEEGSILEVEEESIDLAQVGLQTRRLLRLLLGGLTLVGIWFVWADAMPVLRYLDSEPFIGKSTIADLLLGVLIVVVTVVLARNLPGILEITLLAGIGADGGVRYAISALVQYAVIAIGFLAAFEAIGMDWSKFGWMAAALGVGLGFGLQEIVANFVSGIILLFERPIRVGDVVTIGETTGVVSRIRIRATTITDWDRKEYVVPNKEFITGRLLNWTLSNKVNRLVIKVGVSYGADAERVRDLLLGIVNGHPAILEDPAPGVTFDNFGDSSLDFTIRCFLPDLDRRLATTHELHSQIHERFAKEGIEIPFPQRDLHVRSGWGG